MRSEVRYQASLIVKLQKLFPMAFILRLPPKEYQGIPDILLLFEDTWAMLEVKKSATADIQPNQEHYVRMFNNMSFAAFIYPENEEQVLNDLQSTFGARREARLLKS